MKPRPTSERLALMLLATVAMWIGALPGAWAAPDAGATPAPGGLSYVEVICDNQLAGLAAPISAFSAVTAAHVTEGCVTLGWRTRFKSGRFLQLKRDAKQDWALLLVQYASFDTWMTVAKDKPKNGDRLWWYLLLPGEPAQEAPVSGTYIGEADSDISMGDEPGIHLMYVDGVFYPGSSGGPLANADGELVAIGKGWYFRAPDRAPSRAVGRFVPMHVIFKGIGTER